MGAGFVEEHGKREAPVTPAEALCAASHIVDLSEAGNHIAVIQARQRFFDDLDAMQGAEHDTFYRWKCKIVSLIHTLPEGVFGQIRERARDDSNDTRFVDCMVGLWLTDNRPGWDANL